ncbi:hypothetical protein V5N11_020245 [Cardamine amara subsp. amara]|uniref:Uncharacterized protein n=1 Tax=Cardamine amara subsp. amara TaxID=228776 RepID=A0ABD1C1K8_CARAN
MANPNMNPIDQEKEEEDHLVLDLMEFLSSVAVESLSGDNGIISLDVSCSVIPPPQKFTETDAGDDLFATDFDLGDGLRYSIAMVMLMKMKMKMTLIWMIRHNPTLYPTGDHINRDGDVDSDEDNDDSDLDDELMIPRSLSKKVKKERIRKLGKRVSAKVRNSKRSPYSHLKPGCVHGKHGFGIRFRY